jgi:hypothetical protein
MRKLLQVLFTSLSVIVTISCTKTIGTGESATTDVASSSAGVYAAAPGPGGGGGGSGNGGNPGDSSGLITAGEWNDLDNWDFWNTLLQRDTIKTFPDVWKFYTNNRVTVILKDAGGRFIHDAKVSLTCNGSTVSARTNNFGDAELFPGLFQSPFTKSDFILIAEYQGQSFNLGTYPSTENFITKSISVSKIKNNVLDVMFVVDATGSMGDELSYLKNELKDVINRAGSQLGQTQIRMGSVFYRDIGDEYLTRPFNFTNSPESLNNFINGQSADGGGDFPEAVDEALSVAIKQQSWSADAINRILFLVLDAPPHQTEDNLSKIKDAVTEAQKKGIRIIPVSASGIDWETEFFLRFLSVSTNSTYVFITDDSGIGNPHQVPTVGKYDVEFLNNLMVRLITKYGEDHNFY